MVCTVPRFNSSMTRLEETPSPRSPRFDPTGYSPTSSSGHEGIPSHERRAELPTYQLPPSTSPSASGWLPSTASRSSPSSSPRPLSHRRTSNRQLVHCRGSSPGHTRRQTHVTRQWGADPKAAERSRLHQTRRIVSSVLDKSIGSATDGNKSQSMKSGGRGEQ